MSTFDAIVCWLDHAKPLTDFILQAAIAVGTIGAVLVAVRRPKVHCIVTLTASVGAQQSRVNLQITNPSSRPATIIKIFWRPRDLRDGTVELGGMLFVNGIIRPFPVTISEGEFVEIVYPILDAIASHAIAIEKIQQISGRALEEYISKSYFSLVAVHKLINVRLPGDVTREVASRIEFARTPI